MNVASLPLPLPLPLSFPHNHMDPQPANKTKKADLVRCGSTIKAVIGNAYGITASHQICVKKWCEYGKWGHLLEDELTNNSLHFDNESFIFIQTTYDLILLLLTELPKEIVILIVSLLCPLPFQAKMRIRCRSRSNDSTLSARIFDHYSFRKGKQSPRFNTAWWRWEENQCVVHLTEQISSRPMYYKNQQFLCCPICGRLWYHDRSHHHIPGQLIPPSSSVAETEKRLIDEMMNFLSRDSMMVFSSYQEFSSEMELLQYKSQNNIYPTTHKTTSSPERVISLI